MKIIERGKIPKNTKRFYCKNCGTVFDADKGEYVSADQMEYMHDGILYKCICPVCKKWAYIDTLASAT